MAPKTPLLSVPTRDWSAIPTEIFVIVFSFLCARDRFCCRLICRAWDAAERLLPPPQELPWLMLSRRSETASQRFFCLTGSTSIQISFLEELREAIFCGSIDDWLVLNDKANTTYLLNPVSKSLISLPQGLCYPYLLNYQEDDDVTTPHYLRKVIFSSPPDAPLFSEPCHVAAIYDQGIVLHGWNVMNTFLGNDFIIEDILFDQTCHTKLWLISIDEKVHMEKLRKNSAFKYDSMHYANLTVEKRVEQELDLAYKKHVYLVQFCGNPNIAMVLRYYEGEASDESTVTFRVYELELTPTDDVLEPYGMTGCWVEKNSLDGHVIFLSSNCSKAILASKYEGLEEDKIYFADEIRFANDPSSDRYECGDIGVFSLEDESIVKLIKDRVNSSNSPPAWFFHSDEW